MIINKLVNLRVLLDHRDPVSFSVTILGGNNKSSTLNPWEFGIFGFKVEDYFFADFLEGIINSPLFEVRKLLGIKEDEKVLGIYLSN